MSDTQTEQGEYLHYSGPHSLTDGQRCIRCGFKLVEGNETPFAESHIIYVDTRPSRWGGTPMVDTTDPDGLSPGEAEWMLKLPHCKG